MEDHEKEIAYWAGRLIGYDQAWEVAEEIVEAIKKAQNQALRIHDVSGMCEHPWASVMGDGEMKPAKCLKCGKYL